MAEMKARDGTECKKTECIHYSGRHKPGCGDMIFCRECKWTFKSQFANQEKAE